MAKKTIILSQKQLDEICGGDCSYLDGLAIKPDMGDVFTKEVSSDGAIDGGYPNPTTTDDVSHDITNNWRGNAKLHGMGPITVREMTKKDWNRSYLGEDGNRELKNVRFGSGHGDTGKSYAATKTALSREKAAKDRMNTGATPEIRQKAANTINTMHKNWSNIDNAARQYKAAKATHKSVNDNKPEGMKRASVNNGLQKADGGVVLNKINE